MHGVLDLTSHSCILAPVVVVWLEFVVGGATTGEDIAAGFWAEAGDDDAYGCRFLLEGITEAFLLVPLRKDARGKPMNPWN